MLPKTWTRSEEVELCTLRWLGYTYPEIATILQRSFTSIRGKLYDLSMTTPKRSTGFMNAVVARNHAAGMNDEQSAEAIGCDNEQIRRVRKRLGLPPIRKWRKKTPRKQADAV